LTHREKPVTNFAAFKFNLFRYSKDTNFVLDRMEHDVGTQAIPDTVHSGVQATMGAPKHGATQYEPLEMLPEVGACTSSRIQLTHSAWSERRALWSQRVRKI
jgi:hypothetical protein